MSAVADTENIGSDEQPSSSTPPKHEPSGSQTTRLAATAQLNVAGVPVFADADEWRWQSRGDSVLHIQLRQWADVAVVAPLSANTLAKAALGLCDNLATCVLRAWDWRKPLVVAPAMNTMMYEHPVTHEHLGRLCGFARPERP